VQDAALEEKVTLIQPRGEYRYKYELRWRMADGRELTRAATDTSGLILVDEPPAN
jgi:hypothetical protein